MAKVRSSGTAPEERLKRLLREKGLRFSTNARTLPGKPDIVFQSRGVVVFVHGCFWHGHPKCKRASIPTRNREAWAAKINANIRRDRRVARALRAAGWSVLTIWECQKREQDMQRFLLRLIRKLGVRD